MGNQLTPYDVKKIVELEPIPYEEPESEENESDDDDDDDLFEGEAKQASLFGEEE